ncbi:MAG: hypothetical protein K0S44_394 [Bacteroidetes bacterium]|jgi:hypothetical protein|nr:hypothetical protein [Bacteroidota bacterium]
MKKNYLIAASFFAFLSSKAIAQDTLVYESFNYQAFYDAMQIDIPSGTTIDPLWYNFDGDGLADGSASGDRPNEWYAVQPFSDVDTTNNVAIGSNSWFDSPGMSDNWLITPSFTLRAHDTLFWRSAPSQTPRYLDGYKVKISTTDNDPGAFTTTLFTAAEMTGLGSDSTFSTYSFSTGFVHGQDGTYIDFATTSAPILHNGQLRPFSYPLDAYAGQTVFIAFHHSSFDDNLISIDDFMIRGTNMVTGISENKNEIGLNVFPNPSVDAAQVSYNLTSETSVVISIYDLTGKLISTENKGKQLSGRHFTSINTAALAKGYYTVTVNTEETVATSKMIVK